MKFLQFAEPEPDEESPFTVCGQTVLLCNAALAAALSAQPKQTQEVILRYYFLRQPQRVIGVHIGRDTQHSGAAYPDCLVETAGENGEVPP